MLIGTEGTLSKQDKSIPVTFARLLAKALGLPFAGGFCPVMPTPAFRGDHWTVNTGTVATGGEYGVMAASSAMTYTPLHANTFFDIYYSADSPAFTYQLDGATAITITPDSGGAVVQKTTTADLTLGFHILKINAATANTKIAGADAARPTGVKAHNLAMGGSSADWTTNSWVSGSGLAGRRGVLAALGITADLAITNLGSNDMFQTGTYPNNGDTVVHAIDGLETIQGWSAFTNSTKIVTTVWEVYSGGLLTNMTKFNEYHGAKYVLADELDIPLIDFRWRVGIPVSVPVANGLVASDGIHTKFGTSEDWTRHLIRTIYPNPAVEVAVQPEGGPSAHLPDERVLAEYEMP
jgi:hypothetical protein